MTRNKIAKGTSHPNIALIKYVGKKDPINNIPTNPSISILLPKLVTETTIEKSCQDEFYLDGEKQIIGEKMFRFIQRFKTMSNDSSGIKIKSKNNFPHSCGLASSASGYSALVKALNNYYDLGLSTIEMIKLARLGSGSACRSIEDGISKWDGEIAYKIGNWDELRIFNLVIAGGRKKVGSTEAMSRTVKTSSLFKYRLENIDEKIRMTEKYLKEKNFTKLGELVMKESNEIHAVFLDSYPPILYLEEKSMQIIDEVFRMNEVEFKVFYSFDAGPNPFIFVLDKHFDEVYSHFAKNYQIIMGK